MDTLFSDLGPFDPVEAAGQPRDSRAAADATVIGEAPASDADAQPTGDEALAAAALFLPASGDTPAAGTVAAAAPSFSAQLKDAAARMRAVPLPGAATAREA
jgi:hypothetical protein